VEGNSAKFGLVSVDPKSRERKVKNAGHFYSEIIANGGVTEEMYAKYVKNQEYDIR
jgi:beta-glucosidase